MRDNHRRAQAVFGMAAPTLSAVVRPRPFPTPVRARIRAPRWTLPEVPYCGTVEPDTERTARGFDHPRDRTMNAHGGKRPGAGRPTGAASRVNEQVRQEAAATGELPLAYMLRIMRDPSQPVGRRDEMAKAAAPFCHSRLSSVEHSGEIARPTVIRAHAVSATPAEWQAEYVPGAKDQH
jgi:hypothetical protein